MIGPSTQIKENTRIAASVIGRDCIIGSGTIIRDSYIFDGTVIGSNCLVERSIIGANVTIKDGTRVLKGCLLGEGVTIGPSATLKPFARLSKKREETDEPPSDEEEEEDSDLEDIETSRCSRNIPRIGIHKVCFAKDQDSLSATLGKDSNALVWPMGPPDNAEEDVLINFKNERFMRLGNYRPSFNGIP